jgi:hypothetical protein
MRVWQLSRPELKILCASCLVEEMELRLGELMNGVVVSDGWENFDERVSELTLEKDREGCRTLISVLL